MLNENLAMITNLAMSLFVMTSIMTISMRLKVKPIKPVVKHVYGRHLKPGQTNRDQHGG
jgi:hypothetical protein